MRNASTWALLGTLVATGCAAEADGDAFYVAPGKADNFFSDVATEYEVVGRVRVDLTADEMDDTTLVQERVSRRLTAVALYLSAYVTEKLYGLDRNDDGRISEDELFSLNRGWGGFHAMVRNHTVEATDVQLTSEGAFVELTLDMAGPRDLLRRLPAADGVATDGGSRAFELQMPAGATIDPSDVPRSELREFDPRTFEDEIETVVLTARAHTAIGNAFPHYDAFVEDGVYDITLFYGHDYNRDRNDLERARDAFRNLRRWGFTRPASSFSALTAESGPFTFEQRFGGRDVRIEVRLFHSDMFEGRRPEQHDLAISELLSRDVFFYAGHAGPYSGFYLDEAREAAVSYHELAEIPFDPDRQQLFIANGCQTYSQYADMLYANPARSEDNLDVITTVNYSYGQGTLNILARLVNRQRGTRDHRPRSYYSILRELNDLRVNARRQVFYGVMGLDGNPQLHPYAELEMVGEACAADADCGDPSGNRCTRFGDSEERRCVAVSVGDHCPEGFTSGQLGSSDRIVANMCFR